MLFDQLKFGPHPAGLGGTRAVMEFPNGYGASVITGDYFYTDAEHPYEVAVTKGGKLCYDTYLTEDVLGYQTKADVENLLVAVRAL